MFKTKCDRCPKTPPFVMMMSYFNEEWICEDCHNKEKLHPDYEKARNAESEAVRQGNFNFPGIGKPKDL